MQLGMIGLGRMGANMVQRLLHGGHECVVYDMKPANVSKLATRVRSEPSRSTNSSKLKPPRAAWLMVPAAAVDKTLSDLAARMQRVTSSSTAATLTTSTTSGGQRTQA